MRERLSFILSRSLVGGVGVPRSIRPRLLFRICENALVFCYAFFEILFELLKLLGRYQSVDLRYQSTTVREVLGYQSVENPRNDFSNFIKTFTSGREERKR